MDQIIRFTRHLPTAKVPTQGSAQAAGFDLYAAAIEKDYERQQLIIDTGLKVAFEPGHALFIYSRSGLATKHNLRVANGVGVIDADYRGPVKVILRGSDFLCLSDCVQVGDRIAQAILLPIPSVHWLEVDALDITQRGEGGFGSTGL